MPTFNTTATVGLKGLYNSTGLLRLERSHYNPEKVELTLEGETLDGNSYQFTVDAAELAAVLRFVLQPITPLEKE